MNKPTCIRCGRYLLRRDVRGGKIICSRCEKYKDKPIHRRVRKHQAPKIKRKDRRRTENKPKFLPPYTDNPPPLTYTPITRKFVKFVEGEIPLCMTDTEREALNEMIGRGAKYKPLKRYVPKADTHPNLQAPNPLHDWRGKVIRKKLVYVLREVRKKKQLNQVLTQSTPRTRIEFL